MNKQDIVTIATRLSVRTPLQSLSPNRVWDEPLNGRIAEIADLWTASGLQTGPVSGSSGDAAELRLEALAFQAGLHLWNDDLDGSHSISQQVETATGSLWHGIMHRMEGDYGNAKYWFHRVGSHPSYAAMQASAAGYVQASAIAEVEDAEVRRMLERIGAQPEWNPFVLADAVQRQTERQGCDTAETILRGLQRIELMRLTEHSFAILFGGGLFEAE